MQARVPGDVWKHVQETFANLATDKERDRE
jgi:hypothetical protein